MKKTDPKLFMHSAVDGEVDQSEFEHPRTEHPQMINYRVRPKWRCEIMTNYHHHLPVGREPNWFHRWMQWLFLGFKWVKTRDADYVNSWNELPTHDATDAIMESGRGGHRPKAECEAILDAKSLEIRWDEIKEEILRLKKS